MYTFFKFFYYHKYTIICFCTMMKLYVHSTYIIHSIVLNYNNMPYCVYSLCSIAHTYYTLCRFTCQINNLANIIEIECTMYVPLQGEEIAFHWVLD